MSNPLHLTETGRSLPEGWQPKLVALDIDGTLLKWVEGTGQDYEVIAPELYDAVQAAVDAGAHIVLASGRSPHGMTNVADLLDLPREARERLWVVASNGAVIFRYPPLEVVHEETFDAAEAVRQVLEHHPQALVAVEERGVGYRVNRPFPDGELSGDMIETELHEIIGEPVSRVIIRDPDASADDFVAMAARLGLHGTDYVVGWTAWLDLSPVGVSKASGLEYVARHLSRRQPGRPGHRRRPQRHRDAPLGRPRRGHGPGGRRGARGSRRDHRDGLRRRSRGRAPALVPARSRLGARLRVSLPETVASARLTLRLISPEDAEGMLAGRRRVSWHPDYPRKDDQDAVALVKADDPDASWGPRHIVRTVDGLVVGSIGFFGPPAPGADDLAEAEVGFGLVEEARGHGAVTEALGALLEHTDGAGVRVRASVRPENRASLRVLAKCGFTQLRGSNEDGELVMARPLPLSTQARRAAQRYMPPWEPGSVPSSS